MISLFSQCKLYLPIGNRSFWKKAPTRLYCYFKNFHVPITFCDAVNTFLTLFVSSKDAEFHIAEEGVRRQISIIKFCSEARKSLKLYYI